MIHSADIAMWETETEISETTVIRPISCIKNKTIYLGLTFDFETQKDFPKHKMFYIKLLTSNVIYNVNKLCKYSA